MSAEKESDFSRLQKTYVERVSDRELLIKRSFRASAHNVFRAMTEPALLRRWWAPKLLGVVLIECDVDAKVGGRYRYVFGKPGEPSMAFSGKFTEILPDARIVYTQIFEPMPHTGEGVITCTFEESRGWTLFTSRELYPSKEVLDGAIASGMERGMRETLEQLAALLGEL